MGDAGEGLVDAESRLAERMEEREEEKKKARQAGKGTDASSTHRLLTLTFPLRSRTPYFP